MIWTMAKALSSWLKEAETVVWANRMLRHREKKSSALNMSLADVLSERVRQMCRFGRAGYASMSSE